MKTVAKSLILLPLFISYIFLGAFVFLKIEGGQSRRARDEFFQFLVHYTINHSSCLTSDDLLSLMEQFAVVRAKGMIFPYAVFENGIQPVWSWSNSIVFAATIVTTVGM